VREHQEQAIALLANELDIAEPVLTAVWDEYVLRLELDTSLLQTFVDTGAWITRSQKGFEGRGVPSYQGVLAPEFMTAVAPDRVVSGPR
jgi:hypothetical protein